MPSAAAKMEAAAVHKTAGTPAAEDGEDWVARRCSSVYALRAPPGLVKRASSTYNKLGAPERTVSRRRVSSVRRGSLHSRTSAVTAAAVAEEASDAFELTLLGEPPAPMPPLDEGPQLTGARGCEVAADLGSGQDSDRARLPSLGVVCRALGLRAYSDFYCRLLDWFIGLLLTGLLVLLAVLPTQTLRAALVFNTTFATTFLQTVERRRMFLKELLL